MSSSETSSIISYTSVVIQGRIREDLGDIDSLANSIREYGLIQPVVIERNSMALIAGGRRMEALKCLGTKDLEHGVHFIYRDEVDAKRLVAMELEENLRRKQLTWQEEVIGKQKLLDLLQAIHGVTPSSRPTKEESSGVVDSGFSIRKLAAVLGENHAQTVRDINVAKAIQSMPSLAKSDSKGAVYTRLKQLGTVATMLIANAAKPKPAEGAEQPKKWALYKGDFRENVNKIESESVDFIHTDPPYGASVGKMSSHVNQPGFDDSRTTALGLLPDLAKQAYRILRQNRYAAVWFGFNYYTELVHELEGAGFTVPPVPIVWVKNTKNGENPTSRYSNSYEACLLAVKGQPVLMKPGASNVKTFNTVPTGSKLHVAEKPVDLICDLYSDLVPRGGTIVDFCAGSGSSGVAAIRSSCEVIMFERDEQFCNLIETKMKGL